MAATLHSPTQLQARYSQNPGNEFWSCFFSLIVFQVLIRFNAVLYVCQLLIVPFKDI